MNSRELRLGNWLQYKESHMAQGLPNEVRVTAAMIDYCERDAENFAFEPIPLSEQWHLKFGATPRPHLNDVYYKFGDVGAVITWNKSTHYVYVCNPNSKPVFLRKIDSVHQWQNLFFALTGEELE